jgi:hypothetical protein
MPSWPGPRLKQSTQVLGADTGHALFGQSSSRRCQCPEMASGYWFMVETLSHSIGQVRDGPFQPMLLAKTAAARRCIPFDGRDGKSAAAGVGFVGGEEEGPKRNKHCQFNVVFRFSTYPGG